MRYVIETETMTSEEYAPRRIVALERDIKL